MKCNCGNALTEENLTIVTEAHDDEILDLVLTCPACDAMYNTFLKIEDFSLIEY